MRTADLLAYAAGAARGNRVRTLLLMLAMAVMLGTLLGDVLQALMDPRVRAALA